MRNINLAFRISEDHVGKGKIETPGVKTQHFCRPWSYARHLPEDWDRAKIARRTAVAERLWVNLVRAARGGTEMDLNPLLDDQRAAGTIGGANPLQAMYELVSRLAEQHPDYPFFGMWGGYKPWRATRRFVLFVEDAQDAALMIERLKEIASTTGVPLDVQHQYGLKHCRKHVTIDERLRSAVTKPEEFESLLLEVADHPHFFHELF